MDGRRRSNFLLSIRGFAALYGLLFHLTATANAATDIHKQTDTRTIQTCQVGGRLLLEAPTQIFCAGDLFFAPSTEIITQGYALDVIATGTLNLGSGIVIHPLTSSAGPIFFHAATATGHLNVNNEGVRGPGGDVELQFGTTRDYSHEIIPGRAARRHHGPQWPKHRTERTIPHTDRQVSNYSDAVRTCRREADPE
ncbi:MAG: hypothetical protein HC902_08340 [Calothrix sp. SM1_5_4]|nr:hypothetical protein [Calothrix sp. SM1_5_4]